MELFKATRIGGPNKHAVGKSTIKKRIAQT